MGIDLVALAQRARDGDVRACDELLAELYKTVRKHVAFVVGTGPIAEEAVQDTMIAVYHGLGRFRGEASPRTWALTIATRTARRLWRKEARYQLGEDAVLANAAAFDVSQQAAAELAVMQRHLARLAPKKREAFVLMAIGELTADEAGRVLGTFANTAASRFRHARAELEAMLGTSVDGSIGLAATKGER